jgi:hypothetical protein
VNTGILIRILELGFMIIDRIQEEEIDEKLIEQDISSADRNNEKRHMDSSASH